jgi:hypothetical protein
MLGLDLGDLGDLMDAETLGFAGGPELFGNRGHGNAALICGSRGTWQRQDASAQQFSFCITCPLSLSRKVK